MELIRSVLRRKHIQRLVSDPQEDHLQNQIRTLVAWSVMRWTS